jgi:AcrR family transcriptional regulator
MTRLLDATEAVIAEEGWTAATTRRVAERAGVAQGLVHYHADSIDALRREATLRAIRRFFDQPLDAYEPTVEGAREWVAQLISPGSGGKSQDRELRLLHESLPAAGRDELLRTEIAALLGGYRERIASILEAQGHPRASASALAVTIAASVDGAVLQRSLDPKLDLAPIAEVLATAVLARPAS